MSVRPTPDIRFERPEPEQLRRVAELRWDGEVRDDPGPAETRGHFVDSFQQWGADHDASHLCLVGVDPDDDVVAFGFVALTPRVPSPSVATRRSADIQTVFVVPALRNSGIGGRLIDLLVGLAREQGAEHVTVHSSPGAVTAYERAGFTHDPLMLNQILRQAP